MMFLVVWFWYVWASFLCCLKDFSQSWHEGGGCSFDVLPKRPIENEKGECFVVRESGCEMNESEKSGRCAWPLCCCCGFWRETEPFGDVSDDALVADPPEVAPVKVVARGWRALILPRKEFGGGFEQDSKRWRHRTTEVKKSIFRNHYNGMRKDNTPSKVNYIIYTHY